jgi:hypothetical protein
MNPHNPYRITQEELNGFAQALHSCGVHDEQKRPLIFNINNFWVMRGLVVDLDGEVEKAIIKSLYPPVTEGVFYHFTSADAAKNILREKKIRFHSIMHRIQDNELERIDTLTNEKSYRIQLAKKYFYLSLTDAQINDDEEAKFYQKFGRGDGTRLKIRLTCENIMCRKMNYNVNILDVFSALNACAQKYGYTKGFMVNQYSRFLAYILPDDYEDEKETRALYINDSKEFHEYCERLNIAITPEQEKSFKQVVIDPDTNKQFVEFELGKNDFGYKFEILEVNTPSSEIENIPKGNYEITSRK